MKLCEALLNIRSPLLAPNISMLKDTSSFQKYSPVLSIIIPGTKRFEKGNEIFSVPIITFKVAVKCMLKFEHV